MNVGVAGKNVLPVLYSFRRCPYAIRARLALAVSGRKYELREVVLREKPASMLALSPKGTVPVLALGDGTVLDESLDIMLWSLKHSDPFGWLAPEKGTLQEMLTLVACADGDFKYHLDRYKYADRYEGASALNHRRQAGLFLAELEKRLSGGGCLFGAKPSLADIAIMPFIRQFANTDRLWFDRAPCPFLQKWLARFLGSGLFVSVMKKYRRWEGPEDFVVFPEKTRVVKEDEENIKNYMP